MYSSAAQMVNGGVVGGTQGPSRLFSMTIDLIVRTQGLELGG